MRSLFCIGAKLLGIVYFSWFLISLIALATVAQCEKTYLTDSFRFANMASSVLAVIINLIFSYFLLFRTKYIATFLKIEDTELKFGSFSIKSVTQVGVQLIGLFIFVSNISDFLRSLLFRMMMITSTKNISLPGVEQKIFSQGTSTLDVVINAVPIIFSLIFIFMAGKVVKIISEDPHVETRGFKNIAPM